ncbi:MAG: DUF167 domain-containing protein [bacterium]|jgi:uncharacterized protein (TIGR00251 family)|tara:strand:+ start:378 stop:635 length:258 start_codon:yes stop_codon:yes gene_type:complete
MKIRVSVKPRSLLSKVVSFEGNMLYVNVKAIPYKGKSNLELIKTLSTFFKIPKSKISILKGSKSKIKELDLDDEQKVIVGLKKLL